MVSEAGLARPTSADSLPAAPISHLVLQALFPPAGTWMHRAPPAPFKPHPDPGNIRLFGPLCGRPFPSYQHRFARHCLLIPPLATRSCPPPHPLGLPYFPGLCTPLLLPQCFLPPEQALRGRLFVFLVHGGISEGLEPGWPPGECPSNVAQGLCPCGTLPARDLSSVSSPGF